MALRLVVPTAAIAVALMLASAIGCDSSDDEHGAVEDARIDIGGRRCGFASCCCKDGHQTPAMCAADGTGMCAEGWQYHYDDCPFQSSCRAVDAALPDTSDARADADTASCDPTRYCCCAFDLAMTPTCSATGLACLPGYRLLTNAQCATECTYRPTPDAGAFDARDADATGEDGATD
jgi:hypothetical protein